MSNQDNNSNNRWEMFEFWVWVICIAVAFALLHPISEPIRTCTCP